MLLNERVRAIRAAARLLYQRHPRILAKAESPYERKRKAKWRKKTGK